MDREARKKAMEAKRARLKQLRSESSKTSAAAASAAAVKAPEAPRNEGLDNLISELLSKPATEGSGPESSSVPSDAAAQALSSVDCSETRKQEDPKPSATTAIIERTVLKCAMDVGTINIARKELVTYDKAVQTDPVEEMGSEETSDASREGVPASPKANRRNSLRRSQSLESSPAKGKENSSGNLGTVDSLGDKDTKDSEVQAQSQSKLDDDERSVVEKEDEYGIFVSQSTRVVERLLKQNNVVPDLYVDYAGGIDNDGTEGGREADKLKLLWTISDDKWTKDRAVTEIQWSPHHQELFLTAQGKRMGRGLFAQGGDENLATESLGVSGGSGEPNGVVCVWSTFMASERPEYVFNCQSAVETATFHPFSASLVIGATYAGQVVLWDLRAKSAPVQRSLLSAEAHTHPVFSMAVTGTANAHSVTTVSTDGKLCVWDLSNISQPKESRMLKWNKKDIVPTTMAFPDGEVNDVCIGTEDGGLIRAQVHGNKAGVSSMMESAHFGPITQLDFNKGSGALSELMLTSSMDWTVKLWSQRLSESPLATFDTSRDYVFDAQWNPAHPAVFASANGAGVLDIWNLSADMEQPAASIDVTTGLGNCALSSLRWAPDGKSLLVGDAKGRVRMYEVSNDLCAPRRDEWVRMENTVETLAERLAKR